jgi:hypothetical protein
LKLSGLVKRDENGVLVPRNRIYEHLFNLESTRAMSDPSSNNELFLSPGYGYDRAL